jgi:CheY-like chemotaxis protein
MRDDSGFAEQKRACSVVASMNAARSTMGEPVPAPPPTILVVEDDVLVRSLVAAYLRECGFDVIEANGADEAIRVMEAEVRVDIVFSDIQMPGSMDGFGLAQWVRRERPWLKVILTSGAARTARAAGDLREHGPILAKPYDHAELERHIRTLLAR